MSSEYERWVELVDRETIGEPLSPHELEFVRHYAERDSACRAELALLGELGELDRPGDDLGARRVCNAALERSQPRPEASPRVRPLGHRIGLWAAGGALAAAAAVALFVTARSQPASEVATTPLSWGTVRTASGTVRKGATVAEGDALTAVSGVACVDVSPGITTCLAEGTRLRLTEVDGDQKRLDLLDGRVVAALDPQPAGSRFSIVAAGIWSTAVGTAFSVEVNEDGVVQTDVYEGEVRVGGERTGALVPTHKLGLATTRGVQVESLEEPADTPAWRVLSRLTGKSFELPKPSHDSTAEPAESPTDEQTAELTAPKPGANAEQKAVAVEAVAPPPSVDELLAKARGLMAEHRWNDAARAYRTIRREHPSSASAHTVLVSLGQLELRRLGQPARALRSFDAYLAGGGPLALEARLGRIEALRALGDSKAEAEAIREVLRKAPHTLQGDALRKRLQNLEE